MKPTVDQTIMLAHLERKHGRVPRLPDEHPLADQLLSRCVTGTRVYRCESCAGVFTIEPDGETWVYVARGRLVD